MNQLQFESSPYLRQHAANPVDWYPWCNEALNLADELDRPILLSIGYSTCHWCHVMAKECFEDDKVAQLMNEHFVNIKVDREERPDLDQIYQSAHGLLTQRSGGWPLTVFLNPKSRVPFFAGTYFPKASRFGLPGFPEVLQQVSRAYAQNKDRLEEFDAKLLEALSESDRSQDTESKRSFDDMCSRCRDILVANYDAQGGGFGTAPKFPQPMSLSWLLKHWYDSRNRGRADSEALDVVIDTLTRMGRGGIFDHLGGGFFRYSTDRSWTIPHFEKMLYDNALLLGVYADAYALTGDQLFEEVLSETANWVLDELRTPDGGFFSAIDADSEGEEGKYYAWRRNEVKRALTDEEYLVVETLYGLDKPTNFETRWHLHRTDAWRAVVHRLSMDPEHAYRTRQSARAKLRALRAERIPPVTDTKVLTSWNGLTIGGLAKASRSLNMPDLVNMAQATADFLRHNCFDGHRLNAVWCDGKAKLNGYLDDYAHLLNGLLDLVAVSWRHVDVEMAKALADSLINWFYDSDDGGFWFTAHDHEDLIYRAKPSTDGATPSGNGAACLALIRLADLSGQTEYLEPVERTLEWAGGFVGRNEAMYPTLVQCMNRMVKPHNHILMRGPRDLLSAWLTVVHSDFHPDLETWAIPHEDSKFLPEYLPKLIPAEERERVTAYICEDFVCSAPINDLDEFQATVAAMRAP